MRFLSQDHRIKGAALYSPTDLLQTPSFPTYVLMLLFRKPCNVLEIILFPCRRLPSLFMIIFSKILSAAVVKLIGLRFRATFLFHILQIGVTFAIFRSSQPFLVVAISDRWYAKISYPIFFRQFLPLVCVHRGSRFA